MSAEMKMTLIEMDLAIGALDALRPDTHEAARMINEFRDAIRHEASAIDPDFGGDRVVDPQEVGAVSASENAWAALADGLDTLEGEGVREIATTLSERARAMRDDPEPGL